MNKLFAHITPSVLRWARETAGFEIDNVVAALQQGKVTHQTILDWESGQQQLYYTQFEKLATLYKRPLALFFMHDPPKEETLNEEFRSLPDYCIKDLPPKMRFIVRKAKIRQLDLVELLNNTPSTKLAQFEMLKSYSNDIKRLARQVREVLDISLQEQKGWENADFALKQWRSKLESFGIWVFKDSYRKGCTDYDGFFLPHRHFPIIHINNSKPQVRQIFTLFHELGHFFLSKGGICFRSDTEHEWEGEYKREEVFCNAFAGECLIPDEELNLKHMLDDTDIKTYANTYKVSKEVILRKCKDKGLIGWEQYNKKIHSWHNDADDINGKSQKSGGGNYYATQRAYLSERYLELAFSQFYQQRISDTQLADYLGVKVKSLPKLEAVMYRGRNA